MHGANLARALRSRITDLELFGMGGPLMRAAGVDIQFDPTDTSTIGFMEALFNLAGYHRMLHAAVLVLAARRPAAVVWIDFGGYNLALAKECRRLDIPVVCVFSPSAWAYGSKRARVMAQCVTELAAVLPFEADFYRAYGLKATFVGHPLLDVVHPSVSPSAFRAELALGPDEQVLALLPGSRRQEIERLLPIMLAAARILIANGRRLRLILPRATSIPHEAVARITAHSGLPVTIVDGRAYDVLAASTVAIVASGTVTLEAAILATPLVSIYRVSPVSIAIYRALRNPGERGKRLTAALPNLIAGRQVVPELLQEELSGAALADEVAPILERADLRTAMIAGLQEVRSALGSPGAMDRIAGILQRVAGSGSAR